MTTGKTWDMSNKVREGDKWSLDFQGFWQGLLNQKIHRDEGGPPTRVTRPHTDLYLIPDLFSGEFWTDSQIQAFGTLASQK